MPLDNSTAGTANETVVVLTNLIVSLLPLIIIVAIFAVIVHMFLGRGGGLFSKLEDDDSPEPTRQTFGSVVEDHHSATVTCSYCGGEAYGTELQCPHCYAPASKAFPRVA
jgi:hypothetical protein